MISECLAECEVDAAAADQGMISLADWCDAMKGQPCSPAPYCDVAMFKPVTPRPIAAQCAAEQEDRRQAKRDRDDGRGEVLLVLVLMQ